MTVNERVTQLREKYVLSHSVTTDMCFMDSNEVRKYPSTDTDLVPNWQFTFWIPFVAGFLHFITDRVPRSGVEEISKETFNIPVR